MLMKETKWMLCKRDGGQPFFPIDENVFQVASIYAFQSL